MRKDIFVWFLFLATTICCIVVIVTIYGSSTINRSIKVINDHHDSHSKTQSAVNVIINNDDEVSSTISIWNNNMLSFNRRKRLSNNNNNEEQRHQQEQQLPTKKRLFPKRQRFIFHKIEFLPNNRNDNNNRNSLLSESSSFLLNNESEIVSHHRHRRLKQLSILKREQEEADDEQQQQKQFIVDKVVDYNNHILIHSNMTTDNYQTSSLGMENDSTWKRKIAFRVLYESRTTEESSTDDDFKAVAVSFEDIYMTLIFMGLCWGCGMISVYVFGLPGLVGEIICGMLLGPPLLNVVPFPEAMVLVGHIGLIGLMLEAGMGIDIANLKEAGARAFVIGTVGTFLPLVIGGIMGYYMWDLSIPSSIAFGTIFAPTSFGVASIALSANDYLNTPIGGMIVASSVVDDVWGLSLLSILQVLVDEDATIFDYIKPFLSSFGWLLVLGFAALTWLPWFIDKKILSRIPDTDNRNMVACALMFLLMLAYMPLLNYTKASYLTGIFLAGLSFSQIRSVPITYAEKGRPALNWLLQIFFAATIGFQVPVRLFANDLVFTHGLALLLPVLMKVPLAFFVPTFNSEAPKDFPYNPRRRDMIITALAMTCRGEFNFIIGSFALQYGLIEPNLYAAAVIAMLATSIIAPFGLSISLRYYNAKSREYLVEPHLSTRVGDTIDGCRPLFLAIQARTPVYWGLQERFKKVLETNGLIIIDHRSWHTMSDDRADFNHMWNHEFGKEAVYITEIFVQDTKVQLKIKGAYDINIPTADPVNIVSEQKENLTVITSLDDDNSVQITDDEDVKAEEGKTENELIKDRCNEIRNLLIGSVESRSDSEDPVIYVKQWKTFHFKDKDEKGTNNGSIPSAMKYSLVSVQEFDGDSSDASGRLTCYSQEFEAILVP